MSYIKAIYNFFLVLKELLVLVKKVTDHIEEKKEENKAQGIADLKAAKTDEDRKNALKKITGNS